MSFTRVLSRHRMRGNGEEGIAMIMVIGVIGIMTVLIMGLLTYAIQTLPRARHDQDWNGALAAAQAGVDDYVSHLNKTDSYASTVDCGNLALKGPKVAGSCGYTSSTLAGWLPANPARPTQGSFHYDADITKLYSSGYVQLNSTGKVNGTSRTLVARVSRGGTTQFLYYTDFEDADPNNTVPYPNGAPSNDCGLAGSASAKYWYQTRSNCTEIQFAGFDVLDGKVHFNDSPLMGSVGGTRPQFKQGYETADPNCTVALGTPDSSGLPPSGGLGKCWRNTSSATPYVATAGIKPVGPLYLQDNSDQFVTFPGCQYTGDTRIRFNADGTMDVWNTLSSGTTVTGPGTPAGTNCGNAASFVPASGQKYPTSAQHLPVPDDMVIYVKGASTSGTCTPGQVVNGSTSGSASNDVIPQGSGTSSTGITDLSYFNPASVDNDTDHTWTRTKTGNTWSWTDNGSVGPTPTVNGDVHQTTYDCGLGNVYVEGTVKGRVTIAAENNIIVTGDLLVSTTAAGSTASGRDMVGLVATNSVVVYHPVQRSTSSATSTSSSGTATGTCAGSNGASAPTGGSTNSSQAGRQLVCTYTATTNYGNTYSNLASLGGGTSAVRRYIYASVQTLKHSFTVQNYHLGAIEDKLSVRGSIAQEWRGAVGTSGGSGTGFAKDYSYDARLQFASPPYFPQFVNAVWGAQTTGEVRKQY